MGRASREWKWAIEIAGAGEIMMVAVANISEIGGQELQESVK
jgi:hypothetical protein